MRILAEILALITRKPRYYEKEEWIKDAIFQNLYIAFRKLFWRKYGLQPQMSSWADSDGNKGKVFYTLESFLVHYESVFRQWIKSPKFGFKLVKVYLPVFSPIDSFGWNIPKSPYLFAIAHDTDSSKASTSSTTSPITNTHTVASGGIRIGGYIEDNTTTAPPNGT